MSGIPHFITIYKCNDNNAGKYATQHIMHNLTQWKQLQYGMEVKIIYSMYVNKDYLSQSYFYWIKC